jgi:2-aminoadipate transaminase
MYLYERIYLDLRRLVEEGEVHPGERLPSIRDAAERYGCNKITAQKAYDMLRDAGLAENQVGSGSFALRPSAGQTRDGELAVSILSEDFFPYGEAGGLLSETLASERGRVFSAPVPRGDPGLRDVLAGIYRLPSESLLILSGAQQGLNLCRRLFGDRAKLDVLAEDPAYPAALALFRPSGQLPLGHEGPDPVAFDRYWQDRKGSGTRIFYSVPDFHNPTGIRYSPECKRALAEYARSRDVWILEDDYLSETDPSGVPRFVDLIPERTIWIKSLSKTTAPGIRVGLLSAPENLIKRFEGLKAETDPGPATWLQLFLDRVYRSGLYERHLAACIAVAKARQSELLGLLSRYPGLSVPAGGQGWNLWVRADREPDLASPPWAEGKRFGTSPETRASFRLSFMSVGPASWPAALARLESALDSAFKTG